MIVSTLVITIILIYLLLISGFTFGFDRVNDFRLQDLPSKTKFTIVIPFRNEAKNLPKLLDSISKLNYPKSLYEVILVNDGSKDNSVEVIEKILNTKSSRKDLTRIDDIKVIENKRTSNSPKKDAIISAIDISINEWIITTDADCILPKYWLDSFDEYIQTQSPNCIIAPVTYYNNNSFFKRFQTLDFLSLQGVTIGSFGLSKPFLCNGANFGYRKSVFKELNGFDGNTNISSGDDIFLLEKFKDLDSKKVHYLKSSESIVYTNPTQNFKDLTQQRLRWASKTSLNPNWFSKGVGIIVLLANTVCIALIPLALFNLISPRIALSLFVIKFSIDFLILFKTARFFKQEAVLLSYIFSSVLYPFFSVYIVILSFFKAYHWKGRTFRK